MNQLDVTFKDQREEADTKLMRLEGLLSQRQMDLDHRVAEVRFAPGPVVRKLFHAAGQINEV